MIEITSLDTPPSLARTLPSEPAGTADRRRAAPLAS